MVQRFGATAAITLFVLGLGAASAQARDMTIKGRFTCNDGQPLADMRVELMHTYSRLLPEIWPNQRVEGAGRTGPNGEFQMSIRGGETNWRVRAVLVNNDVGVKNFPVVWHHHYHDTIRTQNNRPLADYGTQVVPGAECRLWTAFKAAADAYRRDTGTSNPGGKITVLDNAPTSGVPFTPYTDVFWPGNYPPIPTAQHEFAHSVRHQFDGDKGHFLEDSARYWYLRSHSASKCESTNHGFAFNEGWAEYWADEVQATPCPNAQDFSIERNVAFELKRLQSACIGVTRGRMVQVLAQNPLRIHSMSNFSNALGCQPKRVIKSSGKAARPASAVSALVTARVTAGRAVLTEVGRLIARMRSAVPRASGFAERELARARLDQARALRSTLAYLASRAEQLRIARLSDKRQLDLLTAKQREYRQRVRSSSADALRAIAERLRRDGNREGAQVMTRAATGAAAGRPDVLQATGAALQSSAPVGPAPGPGPDAPVVPGVPVTPTNPPPTLPGSPLPNPLPPTTPPGTPTPPTPTLKPDLVIPLVVSLVYRPEAGGSCTVNYRRRNEGTAAAGASTTSVQLTSPGQLTLTNTIAAVPLTPGQEQQESILFPGINCDPDVYEVAATVIADSAGAVDELNEVNNTTTRQFGPAPPLSYSASPRGRSSVG